MNPPQLTDQALDEIAAEWLCERDEGFAPGRAQELADWRQRDPRHAAALARVERTWALLAELPAAGATIEARSGGAAKPTRTPHVIVFPRPAFWASGLAAVLLVGLMLAWTLRSRVPAPERYVASPQSPLHVALADGSSVDVNAGGEVRVQFSTRERRVELVRGEAHFTVAKNPERPFWVEAGAVSVRAVGTAFNVRRGTGEIEVLVTEGKVDVQRVVPDEAPATAVPDEARAGQRAAPPVTHLVANQRALVIGAAPAIAELDAETIRATLAWREAQLVFLDTPLRDIVARFNARNTTQLVLADAGLGARKIGGMIAFDQVEAFVRLLEQDGDVAAERRGDTIVLRRAR